MIKIKAGVRPRMLNIAAAVANVAIDVPFDVVITSGADGKHIPTSRHYFLEALDVRSKNFPSKDAKHAFVKAVLKRLGPDYQGFLEAEGRPNEHFHFEYDPK